MRIEIATKQEYIPEWNGNRQLPEHEQIRVEYKTPTKGIRNKYLIEVVNRSSTDAAGKVSVEGQGITRIERIIIEELVTKVVNLEVGNAAITTPKELLSESNPAQIQGLIDEVQNFLAEILMKQVDGKN